MRRVSIFDKIDSFFDRQPNRLVYTSVMALCIAVSVYLVYDYAFEGSEDYLKERQEEYNVAESELKKYLDFSNMGNNNERIEKMKQDLAKYEEEIKITNENNEYFTSKLQKISSLLYNKKTWSNFMSKLNKEAKNNNVVLSNISSNINDLNSQKVEEAFSVSFRASGRFHNILHFINGLENSTNIVDVQMLKLYSNSGNSTSMYNDMNYNNPQPFYGDLNDSYNSTISTEAQTNSNVKEVSYENTKNLNLDIKILVWGIKY